MQKFTTNESVAFQVVCTAKLLVDRLISSQNFLDAPVMPTAQVDKTKERLEQLDQTLEAQEKQMQKMTQDQYVNHIQVRIYPLHLDAHRLCCLTSPSSCLS